MMLEKDHFFGFIVYRSIYRPLCYRAIWLGMLGHVYCLVSDLLRVKTCIVEYKIMCLAKIKNLSTLEVDLEVLVKEMHQI